MDQFTKSSAVLVFLFAGTAAAYALFGASTRIPAFAVAVPQSGAIATPGNYYLDTDRAASALSVSETALATIAITVSDVVLDLRGKEVRCRVDPVSGKSTIGIAISASNVTVRNGSFGADCEQGMNVSASNVTVEGSSITARYIGITGAPEIAGLRIIGNEFLDISGDPMQVYAIGVNVPGDDCRIERNVFQNISRQIGSSPDAPGDGVGVVFGADSAGCIARSNWHENDRTDHLEIGYWVGTAAVKIVGNSLTNIGRGVAMAPGVDADVEDNRFYLKSRQYNSYAIGAQQGRAKGNLIVGYEFPIMGAIANDGNTILP